MSFAQSSDYQVHDRCWKFQALSKRSRARAGSLWVSFLKA